MLVAKQFLVAIDFHSIFLHTIKVNGDRQLFGYPRSLKFIFLSLTLYCKF